MSESCTPHHDWIAGLLTGFLCCGLVVSYLPQHFRIIDKGSSEGFSPWFLLLGSTSAAAAMMNMVTMQWGVIKCCKVLSFGNCFEVTAGVFMVGLQWFLFSIIFVLYMIYYPEHLKYVEEPHDEHEMGNGTAQKPRTISDNWRLAVALASLTAIHLIVIVSTTLFRLLTDRPQSGWATFLGISSATLAATQYFPQLVHTFRMRLVGALSILTMIMQSPGSAFFVISIAMRPGTNWTSWITYAVSGTMQAILLGMCITWHYRQRRLGIDDFGHPLHEHDDHDEGDYHQQIVVAPADVEEEEAGEQTPLLMGGKGRKTWRKLFNRPLRSH